MLSPLSWWNDLFVNVPLAMGFAWLVTLLYRPAFAVAAIVGYWLTNVIGLILLHKGLEQALAKGDRRPYSRRDLARDVAVSLGYTLLLVVLIRLKVLQPVEDYFRGPRNPRPAEHQTVFQPRAALLRFRPSGLCARLSSPRGLPGPPVLTWRRPASSSARSAA
jgi:hypothetical protein